MKSWTVVVFLLFVFYKHCFAECPTGEFNPGPDCSFEVICGTGHAHSARAHYCDCWCIPPLIRDSQTHTCVEKCP